MPAVLGVIGDGQLARMMIGPALALGVEPRVFGSDAGSPAAIAVTAAGTPAEVGSVLAWARTVDVVTFEHEHVPSSTLEALEAAGVVLRPAPSALRFAQDKIAMRERLAALGVPMPAWASVSRPYDIERFLAEVGGTAVLKRARGGYDGRGVRLIASSDDAADWLADGDALLIEERVVFTRELAQVVARRPGGELTPWPVVESVQRDGVCREVIAPAPGIGNRAAEAAAGIAATIAEALDVTGVLAVELFETSDDRLLVNELAMRPHNSAHWSIEGAVTSQFEQHVRAVLDLPLGSAAARQPWAVMVNLLGAQGHDAAEVERRARIARATHPEAKVHLYGKEPRAGRKIGHVTVTGDELDDVAARARAAAGVWEG